MLFCAEFIRNSVRFCDIPTPLTPPLIQTALVRSFYLKYLFAILIQRFLFFERSQTNHTRPFSRRLKYSLSVPQNHTHLAL